MGALGGVGALGAEGAPGAAGGVGTAEVLVGCGALGAVGALGALGAEGALGAAGVEGAFGADGADGAAAPGAGGAALAEGAPGAEGAAGAAGAEGADGAAGAEGAAGGVELVDVDVGEGASAGAGALGESPVVVEAARWRTGVPKKALGRGSGRVPLSSREMELRSMVATSLTWVVGVDSVAKDFTPPVIMTLQNGQPVAISSAPVSSACSVRNSLMRDPSFSSMNMRAPPAPQQKASSRDLSISRNSTPVAWRSSRGGSKTLLCRPRKHGS